MDSFSAINSWVCKEISAEGNFDDENFLQTVIINCDVESYQFTTDDSTVFFVANFNIDGGDNLTFQIEGPSGVVYREEEGVIPVSMPNRYGFYSMDIAGKAPGTYHAKLFNNETVVIDKMFRVAVPDYTCETNGFFCCPLDKMCINRVDSRYVCNSGGVCCKPLGCVTPVSGELTVTIVPDCSAEGLEECDRVIGNVYDYSIHGPLENPQMIELFFRDIDVDCFNKVNVVVAVYDELGLNEDSAWNTYESTVTQLSGSYYSVSAQIDYIGYIAVIKNNKCVPTDCFIPGFNTVPFDGLVLAGDPIQLGVCQVTKECDASAGDICNRKCTQNLDPDCGTLICTSQMNDCCNPEYDKVCDLDCAIRMDPDCADETYLGGLCYPSSPERRGFASCDIHCTGADPNCGSPGCNPVTDDTCDPNCPKLSNRVGYLDIDCCSEHGIPVTDAGGDCCNSVENGVCDPDCVPGLDRDCNKPITCNPNGVKESFEQCDGTDFGIYAGCASYMGEGCEGNLTCTSACKIDSSECQCTDDNGDGNGNGW
ncbi:MAG: hypothetical protein ABIH63_03445 [archaeon]